ncbi:MAG TPA: zinc ribbon domain-containing protein [Bryobacteraceae bacterium]|nr:zinc ribbon domain-containing protein [Bryobacteraceae bacterium]
MPIFEYSCGDCGTKFEQLVRRTAEANAVRCPSCGHDHLTTEYSTFAARSGAAKTASPAESCGSGACGSGFCGSGACGMNFN